MSDLPPLGNPPQGPQQFVAYPKSNSSLPDPEELRALAASYMAFSWVFLIDFLTLIAATILTALIGPSVGINQPSLWTPTPYVLTCFVVVFASRRATRLYAKGMGKNPSSAITLSVILGLQGWFCCGAFGYGVLQSEITRELKKHGLKTGFLGPRKEDVEAVIAQMQPAIAPPAPTGISPENPAS
jgi:hypothetical protein